MECLDNENHGFAESKAILATHINWYLSVSYRHSWIELPGIEILATCGGTVRLHVRLWGRNFNGCISIHPSSQ